MPIDRDFIGYGMTPPAVAWPGGARIAVQIVVNYEEGSEYSLLDGDPHRELTGDMASPIAPDQRDLLNESFFEYGSRVGVWRILELLERHAVKATFGVCAVALERNPAVAPAIVAGGHEVAGHGYRWEEHFDMPPDVERERIVRAVDSIHRTAGVRPRGWYCRTSPSVNTRRLLVEEGGFEYDSDAYNDDVPYFVEVAGKRHVVVPYTGDVNDSHTWASNGFETDFFVYLKDSFDVLYEESRRWPRMMSVGLHLRMVGRPGRIKALDEFLRYAKARPGVWFATRLEIAVAFREAMAAGA